MKEPGLLGSSVGEADLPQAFDDALFEAALARGDAATVFLRSFAAGRFQRLGWPWVETQLATRPPKLAALVPCGLPFGARTWNSVARASAECASAYWRLVVPGRVDDPPNEVEAAIRGLLGAQRPWAAIDFAATTLYQTKRDQPAPALIAEILETAVVPGRGGDAPRDEHHAQELFDALTESRAIDTTRLARLEWAYLPVLEHFGRGPVTLHRALATDPEFFAEVVSWIWKPETAPNSSDIEQETGDEEAQAARSKRACELLTSWRVVPGTTEEGVLDGDALRRWVVAAKDACSARRRGGIGDDQIGAILAHAPAAADGTWPAIPVRELLEETESADLEDGLRVGLYNKRGVDSRAHGAGGRQERMLAGQYRAWAEASARWPRISAVLRRLADEYDADGRYWDLRDARD